MQQTKNLFVTYSPIYLDWQLGEGHPTNPIRAKLATERIQAFNKGQVTIVNPAPREQRANDIAILNELHDPSYVEAHLKGINPNLWEGTKPEVAEAGLAMFSGTVRAVELALANQAQMVFNPMGAKHHAKCLANSTATGCQLCALCSSQIMHSH